MGDLLYVGIFLVCCAATWGVAVLCDRLMPREQAAGKGAKP